MFLLGVIAWQSLLANNAGIDNLNRYYTYIDNTVSVRSSQMGLAELAM